MNEKQIISLQEKIAKRKVFVNPFSKQSLGFLLSAYLIDIQNRNSKYSIDTKAIANKCRFFLDTQIPKGPLVKSFLEHYRDYIHIETDFKYLECEEVNYMNFPIPKLVSGKTLSYIELQCKQIDKKFSGLNILEFGPWLGSITSIFNRLITNHKVHLYDRFIWQDWMFETSNELDHPNLLNYQSGDSFYEEFLQLVKPKEHIHLHKCNVNQHRFNYIQDESVILVVQDFTDEYNSMVMLWEKIKPKLIPGKSIIISPQFGNLNAIGLLKFHASFKHELLPMDRIKSSLRSFLFTP